MTSHNRVALIACGAFNPVTNMHLRMFELAKDHFQKTGMQTVTCGIVSPVHDSYGKKEALVPATHRCSMLQLALESNDWIRVSSWESQQESWTRTKLILQYHQNHLNALINDSIDSPNKRVRRDDISWIPDDLKTNLEGAVQVKLLCGADLLESFGTPGLWSNDDIATIVGQHGLVVITREGSNPYKFIYESDLLTKYQNNITIVTEWITNEVSSTKIRRSLRRGESVKYLLPDCVIDYIKKHSLYGVRDNKYLYPHSNSKHCFLTPSPSDVNMESPSPTSQFDYTQNTRNLDMTFGSTLVGPKISLTFLNANEVDGIVTAKEDTNKKSTMITYPGQAVQIIKTANGEKEIYNQKVRVEDGKVSPVANVQIQITKDGIKVISDKETTVG